MAISKIPMLNRVKVVRKLITGNGTTSRNVDVNTETGYIPIGVVGLMATGAQAGVTDLYEWGINSTHDKLFCAWTSAKSSTQGFYADILYMKL